MDTLSLLTFLVFTVILSSQIYKVNSLHLSLNNEKLNLRHNNAFESEAITPGSDLANGLTLGLRTLRDTATSINRVKREDADKKEKKDAPEDKSVNADSDASKSGVPAPSSVNSTNSSATSRAGDSDVKIGDVSEIVKSDSSEKSDAKDKTDANDKSGTNNKSDADAKSDSPSPAESKTGNDTTAGSDGATTSKSGSDSPPNPTDPALKSAPDAGQGTGDAKKLQDQKVNKLKEALTGVLKLGSGMVEAVHSGVSDMLQY